jgi:hypothetical protein
MFRDFDRRELALVEPREQVGAMDEPPLRA